MADLVTGDSLALASNMSQPTTSTSATSTSATTAATTTGKQYVPTCELDLSENTTLSPLLPASKNVFIIVIITQLIQLLLMRLIKRSVVSLLCVLLCDLFLIFMIRMMMIIMARVIGCAPFTSFLPSVGK